MENLIKLDGKYFLIYFNSLLLDDDHDNNKVRDGCCRCYLLLHGCITGKNINKNISILLLLL